MTARLGDFIYSYNMERKEKIQELRYGENPHQKASLYKSQTMADYEILWGKELSYNNIVDTDAAMQDAEVERQQRDELRPHGGWQTLSSRRGPLSQCHSEQCRQDSSQHEKQRQQAHRE